MTFSHRKSPKGHQPTKRGGKGSSSTSRLVQEINVIENDKRRMDEWRHIFSNFSSDLGSLLSDSFHADTKPERVERLIHRHVNCPNATKRWGTKSSSSESKNPTNEKRALLRGRKAAQSHNRKRKTSSENEKSIGLVEEKPKDVHTRKKLHATRPHKVTAGKNRRPGKVDETRSGQGRSHAARSADKQATTVRSGKRIEGGSKKTRVTVREDENCDNNYRHALRKKCFSTRREDRKRELGQAAARYCEVHEEGRICIDVETILQLGLQMSNDVVSVIQNVTKEVEKIGMGGERL